MASEAASNQLNAEPSQPDDREKQQLPPKSYVDAVQQDPAESTGKPVNGSNGETHSTAVDGIDEVHPNLQVNGDSNGNGPRAAVLRIVPTNGESKTSETTTNGEGEPSKDGASSDKVNGSKTPETKDKSDGAVSTEESKIDRPAVERQESQHEFEAAVRKSFPR